MKRLLEVYRPAAMYLLCIIGVALFFESLMRRQWIMAAGVCIAFLAAFRNLLRS